MTQRTGLPDLDTLNPEALKALIVEKHEQILSKDEQLLSKDEQLLHKDKQLASRDEEIERLKLLIAKQRRMQFGRKSEKLGWQIEQLQLRLDELEASRAQHVNASTPAAMAASVVHRAVKRARQPLPPHLPRETRKVLPKQEACPDCGGAYAGDSVGVRRSAYSEAVYCQSLRVTGHNFTLSKYTSRSRTELIK